MPATVNVNNLTVVHAASGGTAMSFPDVCKTPTPGGPIPIPYPNIAQSNTTADGTTTVKVDGNPIMLKSSNFSMSSGDEAGSAMGVVSNKIKGKATPVNASFDVKADGTNVFRLTDPMQTNGGSTGNAMNPAEVQGPVVVMPSQSEACKATKKKQKEQKASSDTQWGARCGIIPEHRPKIQAVCSEMNIVLYMRWTNVLCGKWIQAKHRPKPHATFYAKTLSPGGLQKDAQAWLDQHYAELREKMSPVEVAAYMARSVPDAQNKHFAPTAAVYLGVVVVNNADSPGTHGKPISAKDVGGAGRYKDKWITGDYDLFQVLSAKPGCNIIDGVAFGRVQREINKRLGWDAIQHGAQADWEVSPHEQKEFNIDTHFHMPSQVTQALKGQPNLKVKVGKRELPVLCAEVTMVTPKGATSLDSKDDVVNALLCRECEKAETPPPKHAPPAPQG